jgi:hypothetical protein
MQPAVLGTVTLKHRQDSHEAILKRNNLLTLSNAELNNKKLTTTKNQTFMFCTKPNKQKVP